MRLRPTAVNMIKFNSWSPEKQMFLKLFLQSTRHEQSRLNFNSQKKSKAKAYRRCLMFMKGKGVIEMSEHLRVSTTTIWDTIERIKLLLHTTDQRLKMLEQIKTSRQQLWSPVQMNHAAANQTTEAQDRKD